MKLNKRKLGLLLAVLVALLILPAVAFADPPYREAFRQALQKQRFKWIVTKRLDVTNRARFYGLVEVNNELHIDNSQDSIALNVEGHTTQTADLFNLEQYDGTDKFDVTNEGLTSVYAERDAATGSDSFLTVTGDATAVTDTAHTTGIAVVMNRPVGSETGGVLYDAGIFVRVDSDAVTTTVGAVMEGMDVAALADDSSSVDILAGGVITGDTDPGSTVGYLYGAMVAIQQDGIVTTTANALDVLVNRVYTLTAPTNAWGVNLRSTSTGGGPADVGYRLASDGTSTNDDWYYGIDLEPSEVVTADIRLSNAETIHNVVDGQIALEATTVIISANLKVTGTSNLLGDIWDEDDAVTIADNLVVTGTTSLSDTLAVAGVTTLNNNLVVTGTSDLQGHVANSTGDLYFNDNLVVTDTVTVNQLVVTTTSDFQGVIADSTGDLTVNDSLDIEANLDVTGTADIAGDLQVTDNVTITGDADEIQLTIVGNAANTMDVFVIENSAGADILSTSLSTVTVNAGLYVTGPVDIRNVVHDGNGDLTIADNLDIEGNLDVTGTVDFAGELEVTDSMTITGDADEVQLTITANAPNTMDVFVIENSAGADILSTSLSTVTVNAGLYVTGPVDLRNVIHDGDGDLTIADNLDIEGNLVVTGTTDARGNVFDEAGAYTIADNVVITETADAIALAIVGYYGQTANMVVVEAHDGTDHFTVDQGGSVMISGTLDQQGTVGDSNSALTILDNAIITGTDNAIQLTITGDDAQTGNVFVVEDHLGTDHFIIDQGGSVVISGTTDMQGTIGDSNSALTILDNAIITGTANAIQFLITQYYGQALDAFVIEDHLGTDVFVVDPSGDTEINASLDISGTADVVQLTVSGTANQTADLLQLEGTAGTDALQVDYLGAISSDTGDVIIDDDLSINDVLTIPPVTWNGICDGLTCASHPCPSGVLTNTTYLFDSAGNAGILLDTAGSTAGQFCTFTSIDAGQTVSIYVGHAPGGATVQQLDDGDSITVMYTGSEWITTMYINN